jgi:TRAP-type C4-dicarboxylate transport system permease small subunit
MLVVANIVLRRFFNAPIFGSTEIVRYVSLAAASFALAENEWIDGNVKMTVLLESMSKKAYDLFILIGNVVCSAVFILISYLLILQSISKFAKVDVSTELSLPLWIPAAVLAFGFCVLTLSIVIKSVILVYAFKVGETLDFRHIEAPTGEEIPE